MGTGIGIRIRYQKVTKKYLITFSWQDPVNALEEVKTHSQQFLFGYSQLQSIVEMFQKALDEPQSLPGF